MERAAARAAGEEMRHERREVVEARRKCRHLDGEDAEPMEEIGPEPARRDVGGEIAVGGGDDPDVDGARGRRAQRKNLPRVEDAQQPGLHLGRGVSDLVEKQHAAIGTRKQAVARRRSAEGALCMPEELPFDERRREGREVHGNKRP